MAPLMAEMWKGFRVVSQESQGSHYQLDRCGQDDCEWRLDGVSPALWRFGRIESGRSWALFTVQALHIRWFPNRLWVGCLTA